MRAYYVSDFERGCIEAKECIEMNMVRMEKKEAKRHDGKMKWGRQNGNEHRKWYMDVKDEWVYKPTVGEKDGRRSVSYKQYGVRASTKNNDVNFQKDLKDVYITWKVNDIEGTSQQEPCR